MNSLSQLKPRRKARSMPERIEALVNRYVQLDGECWVWHGWKTPNGYGHVNILGLHFMIHRVFYEYFIADIPDGLHIDHLCRVRACVNPWHLEPVTQSINNKRSTVSKHNTRKTHCPQGHPYDEENTLRIPSRPTARYCLTCNREQSRVRRARKRETRQEGVA